MKLGRGVPVAGLICLLCLPAPAQVRITELMASNTRTLADDEGDFPDWIELQNISAATVNLLNWALTDNAGNPAKWLFPATNVPPGGFLVIFASGKDRRTPGLPLHTNFKLDPNGEYLALARPDGSFATELAPAYPPQFPDVSYGVAMKMDTTTLVASNAALLYRVPTNSSEDAVWMQPGFTAQAWSAGTNGVGYETGLGDPQEQSYPLNVLDTQPVAYWRLNETNGPAAANLGTGGVANEAGYQGGITLGTNGPRPPQFSFFEPKNYAPYFNGTNAFVNGPYQLLNYLPEFSMAGWIQPTGTQKSRTGLFGQNDTIEFGFSSASTLQLWTPYGAVSYGYPYPANQWHHLAAVGGNGQLLLYVDGVVVGASATATSTFGGSDYDFNIGGGGVFDAAGNYFLGQIDEVAVWYRALSTNEVAGLVATNAQQVPYTPYLNTDLGSRMYRTNATVYLRIPFTVADPAAFTSLKLLMRYDDGFVAYLNGHVVASANAPDSLNWNTNATQRHLDRAAVQWTEWDVSEARFYLTPGTNVLAVQGLNIDPTNTDFLIQAQLLAQSVSAAGQDWRFFTVPTPGGPNGSSAADQGPIISGAGHWPPEPAGTEGTVVTARVAQAFNTLSNVILHYRVMFNAEVAVPMNDSGTNSDAVAGDGIWTGLVPAGAAAPGQLLRYYVTALDAAGNESRWPIFPDPLVTQQYLGTVATDPSIQTLLPVVYLFIQNTAAGDTRSGTQASFYYGGELYDNIAIHLHGQTSASWPKKSYNIDFPKDHLLLYQAGGSRKKNIRLLSNYGDKARLSTSLTYHALAQAGAGGHFSFQVRVHRNGAFFGLEDLVEDGDDQFLERLGRDPNGALYKMYNALTSASGNEKKTRLWEGTSDLTALITNLDEALPLATRIRYGWDNLDLPQTASYFATMALVSSQDHGHKNYYVYHDNDGTGEWAIFPWDVDLSWGRNWVDSIGYMSDILYSTNVLNFYDPVQQSKPANRLYDLFFNAPDFRQMYLRRLRTLMDTILRPAGTPADQLVLEPVIRQYEDLLSPTNIIPSDATLDFQKWGPPWGDTNLSVMRTSAERTISVHLAGRRAFLFTSVNAKLNGDPIPAAQPPDTTVALASWDYTPTSGNLQEQYVELRNTNAWAADVSGWRLAGAISMELRPGTVIPAGRSLYLSPNVRAFRARTTGPGGGQNLYVQGPFAGYLSTRGTSPLLLLNDTGRLVASNRYAAVWSPPFAPGNLAVLRVGDGVESLSSHGNSVFIEQYTTNGTLVGVAAIPNDDTHGLLLSGSASSEGALSRSADGRLLTFAGYNVALTNSTSSLANSASTNVPRAIGVLDVAGTFTLAGFTTNAYSGNNIRAGTSDGRGNYWGAGANSGTFYFGDGTPATVQNGIANTRVIQDLEGNLYFSTSSGSPGIWKIDGTPAGVAAPGLMLALGAEASPFGFAFNSDFTVAYIADDRTDGNGGVQRWDKSGGNWAFTYAFSGLTNAGARGLAVNFGGASPLLYATTAESSWNRLVSITDTGAMSTITTLATAGSAQLFRGVAFAPTGDSAPQFIGITGTTNGIRLTWTALANRNYTLQYVDDLSRTNWLTLTNLSAAGPVLSVSDQAGLLISNRFYRLIQSP